MILPSDRRTAATQRRPFASGERAAEQARHRGKAPRGKRLATRVRTRLTRNGVHMAFVALFAVLGGSIRGFNLLVIVAGLMVGILIVQWRFCRGTLPGLTVRRRFPPEVYAASPFKVRFWVTNHRPWLAAWLIRLEDRIRGAAATRRGSEAVCGLGVIRPRSTEASHYECVLARRGRYRFGPVRLSTGFPFGLVNAWRHTRTQATLMVYPALASLAPNWSGVVFSRSSGLAASRCHSGLSEGEFFGIRSWRSGDSRRWIHWRTTARIQELAVRQFEQRHRTQLSLILDPYLASGDDLDVEWAISVTASIAADLAIGGTNHVVLGIADARRRTISSHRVTDFRRGVLESLATTRPLDDPPLASTLARVLRDGNPNWPVLIVSPRSERLDLLCDRREHGGITPALVSRLERVWLDVRSPIAHRVAHRVAQPVAQRGIASGTA